MKIPDLNDLIGKKIRMLTVLSFSHIEKVQHSDRLRNKYYYNCVCDCGNTTSVTRFNLMQKNSPSATWSCGCKQKEGAKRGHEKQRGVARPHMQKSNGYSILHTIYLTYKNGAKKRGILFELSEKDFDFFSSKNCFYCNREPVEKKKKREFVSRKMNGVDRLNNEDGYTTHNCVPCCKVCNYMKQELSEHDFYDHLIKILIFKGKIPNTGIEIEGDN